MKFWGILTAGTKGARTYILATSAKALMKSHIKILILDQISCQEQLDAF
jgi:hypothetical protein